MTEPETLAYPKRLTEEEIYQGSLRSVSVAYHEGGHSVTMLIGEHPEVPNEVSIVPGPDSSGHTMGNHRLLPFGEPKIAWVVNNVTVFLAGRASERYLWGMHDGFDLGAQTDLERAEIWVRSIEPETEARQALMCYIEAHTKYLVKTHWPCIKAVAEALLVEKVLDRDRFMDVVEEFQLLDFLQPIRPLPF